MTLPPDTLLRLIMIASMLGGQSISPPLFTAYAASDCPTVSILKPTILEVPGPMDLEPGSTSEISCHVSRGVWVAWRGE